MLDSSPQHATAQEERVYHKRIRGGIRDDETDETVVTKSIPHFDAQNRGSGARKSARLGFGATNRRKIELVRALCELG